MTTEEMQKRIDVLERQNAAMRHALEWAIKEAKGRLPDWFNEALQPDAGDDFVSRAQANPLVDCLVHIKSVALERRAKPEITLAAVGLSAISGIQHAEAIGLL